eukprot:1761178-Prymnesium_polylepis.1
MKVHRRGGSFFSSALGHATTNHQSASEGCRTAADVSSTPRNCSAASSADIVAAFSYPSGMAPALSGCSRELFK